MTESTPITRRTMTLEETLKCIEVGFQMLDGTPDDTSIKEYLTLLDPFSKHMRLFAAMGMNREAVITALPVAALLVSMVMSIPLSEDLIKEMLAGEPRPVSDAVNIDPSLVVLKAE